jgi:hypothetical protein
MIDEAHSQASTWRSFDIRINKVLQLINKFLGSVAICIQHNPQISSLVVGGFHCVLSVSPKTKITAIKFPKKNCSQVLCLACLGLHRVLRKTYYNDGANSRTSGLFIPIRLANLSELTRGSKCAKPQLDRTMHLERLLLSLVCGQLIKCVGFG